MTSSSPTAVVSPTTSAFVEQIQRLEAKLRSAKKGSLSPSRPSCLVVEDHMLTAAVCEASAELSTSQCQEDAEALAVALCKCDAALRAAEARCAQLEQRVARLQVEHERALGVALRQFAEREQRLLARLSEATEATHAAHTLAASESLAQRQRTADATLAVSCAESELELTLGRRRQLEAEVASAQAEVLEIRAQGLAATEAAEAAADAALRAREDTQRAHEELRSERDARANAEAQVTEAAAVASTQAERITQLEHAIAQAHVDNARLASEVRVSGSAERGGRQGRASHEELPAQSLCAACGGCVTVRRRLCVLSACARRGAWIHAICEIHTICDIHAICEMHAICEIHAICEMHAISETVCAHTAASDWPQVRSSLSAVTGASAAGMAAAEALHGQEFERACAHERELRWAAEEEARALREQVAGQAQRGEALRGALVEARSAAEAAAATVHTVVAQAAAAKRQLVQQQAATSQAEAVAAEVQAASEAQMRRLHGEMEV